MSRRAVVTVVANSRMGPRWVGEVLEASVVIAAVRSVTAARTNSRGLDPGMRKLVGNHATEDE